MSVDLRGFDYEAEPILQQRRWQLDATVAELGRLLDRIAKGNARLAQMREQLASQGRYFIEARELRLDPGSHARTLHWLARLQGRIAEALRAGEALERERDEVSRRLRGLQCKVDAIAAHREDAVAEFTSSQAARASDEADRDWLSRRGHAGTINVHQTTNRRA